ncbi:nuclear transport factor 2 family protein [Sansalvadorimonas verongulae]|nr:nuclear transport factor 2 family protein [Sansalvadorimonas verongulae]
MTVLDPGYVVPEKLKGTRTVEGVRAAMDHLIDRATHYDVDALESIYHKDFHTTLVLPDGTVKAYNKKQFITIFRKQAEEGKVQLNTWADWHDFHVLGNSAVSVLTRKHSGMTGEEMLLLCNIELRFEDGRWQVLREQIYLQPLPETKTKTKAKAK